MNITINAEPEEMAVLLLRMGLSTDNSAFSENLGAAISKSSTPRKPRMRTIDEAYVMLRTDDPDTKVSHNAIRKIVINELVPVTCMGRKRLVDYDGLLEYLASNKVTERSTSTKPTKYNAIRRIDE